MQAFGQPFVERLLKFHGPAFVQRNLDDDDSLCGRNIQVLRIIDQAIFIMLSKDLKVIRGWYVDHLHHGLVDNLAQLMAEFDGLALHQGNSDQWHMNLYKRIKSSLLKL